MCHVHLHPHVCHPCYPGLHYACAMWPMPAGCHLLQVDARTYLRICMHLETAPMRLSPSLPSTAAMSNVYVHFSSVHATAVQLVYVQSVPRPTRYVPCTLKALLPSWNDLGIAQLQYSKAYRLKKLLAKLILTCKPAVQALRQSVWCTQHKRQNASCTAYCFGYHMKASTQRFYFFSINTLI